MNEPQLFEKRAKSTCVIYGILDPETHEIRYIGKTKLPIWKRLKLHLWCKKKIPISEWIRSLPRCPEAMVIEALYEGSDWKGREDFWINFFRGSGSDLLNMISGGGGSHDFSAEARLKMSLAKKGKKNAPCSPYRAMAISLAKKGRPNGLLGKKRSPEAIANFIASRLRNSALKRQLTQQQNESRNASFPQEGNVGLPENN
jgi:hypothetical protein